MENFENKDHGNHGKKTILIEATPYDWEKDQISFEEVITLRYGAYDPAITYTLSYEDGPKENREGVLKTGQSVIIKNKMIFHATAGNKS